MGLEAKRRFKLRNLTNDQLLELYDSELVLRLHNAKNLSDTRKILNRFKAYLGQFPPSAELAKGFLAPYAARQPRTLSRYAQMIKAFMRWYGESIEDLKVKIPRSIPKYTEDSALNQVREALANKKTHKGCITRDLLLFDLDHQSGLRRSELANLLVKHIHPDFLEVRKGKGENDRVVPLTSSMSLRLQNFIKDNQLKPDDRLFHLTAGSISNKIRQYADKAGIGDLHTHTLRHKFATDLLEGGTNIRVVQDLMGHENLNTTQLYLSINDAARKEAIRRLEDKSQRRVKESTTGQTSVSQVSSDITPLSGAACESGQPGLENEIRDKSVEMTRDKAINGRELLVPNGNDALAYSLQERHQQKMLQVIERFRQELRISCGDLAIKDLYSQETLRDQNTGLHSFSKSASTGLRSFSLSWQVREGDTVDLCYPLELETDPETRIVRDYLYDHLGSSPYSWILDDPDRGMVKWKQLGGEELKQRSLILNRLEWQVKIITGDEIIIDDSSQVDREGPTPWFMESI